MSSPELHPEEIELHRDRFWRRTSENRVENAAQAERFIAEAGFCSALTDVRRPGASLYVAVCGRRDAHMPRNVQKDPEASLAWVTKDAVMARGKTYYAKFASGRTMFLAPGLIPAFRAMWGINRAGEKNLSGDARAVLKVLRREWEMATADLREEAGIPDRKQLSAAIDELQAAMLVVPGQAVYEPRFTYIWTLPEGRFPEAFKKNLSKTDGLREIARAYLGGAGRVLRGELTKVTGFDRKAVGKAHAELVEEGFAVREAVGVYRLAELA